MDCNVVKDLIPLYIDDCCSEESGKIVKEHIDSCSECRSLYESMKTPSDMEPSFPAPTKLSRVNEWRASILQSVLLFISFAVITAGVTLESATPVGSMNGYWAVSLVIPATGFMLSLANWYFVRLYKSRKSFSNCSLLATLVITVCAYVWAVFHYEFHISFEIIENLAFTIGILITVACCILSKILSDKYAKMLGKD